MKILSIIEMSMVDNTQLYFNQQLIDISKFDAHKTKCKNAIL